MDDSVDDDDNGDDDHARLHGGDVEQGNDQVHFLPHCRRAAFSLSVLVLSVLYGCAPSMEAAHST